MLGANPPATRPAANSTSPATNGRAGPWRSASRPAATTPNRLPRKKALNTQPSRPISLEIVVDDFQDRRDRESLEADQRDRKDQPNCQGAPPRRPHAVRSHPSPHAPIVHRRAELHKTSPC